MASFKVFRMLFVLIAISIFSCKDNSVNDEEKLVSADLQPEQDLKVIAYYTPSTGEIDEETAGQLDQIIYSFLHLNGNKIHVEEEQDSTSLRYLTSLKEANPDLEVLISLGGWGGCETCSEVFSTAAGREEFAQSVKNVLEEYNADGIDLDWEYPAVEGHPGHPYKPEDKQNFTALVAELRETLGEDYQLTFAAPGFDEYLSKSVEWYKVMPLVDHVNLMSYDMVHGGSDSTGHHTALYSTTGQEMSADNSLKYFDSIGIPRDKIVLGAAFYARVWEDVDSQNNGLYQPGKFKEAVLYKDLETFQRENPGFVKYFDTVAQAPYLYNAEKRLFATFDDTTSIAAKTKYVVDNDLKGIMFWQLSGDKKDGLVDIISESQESYSKGD